MEHSWRRWVLSAGLFRDTEIKTFEHGMGLSFTDLPDDASGRDPLCLSIPQQEESLG